jgi:parvulin-like peptidyl-prolyl isomerase
LFVHGYLAELEPLSPVLLVTKEGESPLFFDQHPILMNICSVVLFRRATISTLFITSCAALVVSAQPSQDTKLARRGAESVDTLDHRANSFQLSERDYRAKLADVGRTKLELADILAAREFTKKTWPHKQETSLEAAYRRVVRERSNLESALVIAEQRARDEAQKDPTLLERRAREIYLQTDAPVTRRNLTADFQQIRFDLQERSLRDTVIRVEEVQTKIRQGVDFTLLVKQYSDDKSAAQSEGRHVAIPATALDSQMSKLIFDEMKPGQIAERVVSTPWGLHIVKLHAINEPKKRPFEEVRDAMVKGVLDEIGKAARQRILDEINKEPVQYDETAIEAITPKIDPEAIRKARELSRQPSGAQKAP